MRTIRGLTIAALLLVNAGTAAAQASRGFKDSWFWGAKAGLLSYQVQDAGVSKNNLDIMGGGDWMITRTNGGLYVSFDYSFVSADSLFVNDSISPLDSVPRVVQLSGMRRFTIAGMLYPMQTYRLHPYIGLGISLSHLSKVEPQGTYRNATQQNLVLSTVQFFRSTATPTFIGGAQLRLPLASLFGQLTASPANDNFFLFTGSNWRLTAEAGLRYNVGSSIDRIR